MDSLLKSATNLIDANYILDIVLDNIEEIMDEIPRNESIDDETDRCSTSYDDSVGSTVSSASVNTAKLTRFKLENNAKVELKENIYISKDCTAQLSQVIVDEDWGKDSILLYKYLDYMFRCQLFNDEIIEIRHCKESGDGDEAQYLIFNTGLKRRCDDEVLFVLSTPNFALKPQKWRVQIGNVYNSFLSKHELLHLLSIDGLGQCLPQRIALYHDDCADSLYNCMYGIDVSWEKRLTAIQDRLYHIIGVAVFADEQRKHLKLTQLIKAFDDALSTTKILITLNPKLVVPQCFVDSKRRKCRLELLLPLTVKFHGASYTFALAVSPSTLKPRTYSVKSILTLSMAYSNARLVAFVSSPWLIRD